FSGATPQLIVAHAQKPPPAISTQDQDLPPELDRVMARILAKRPEQRFATGAEFVDSLRDVARRHGLAVASPRQLATLVGQPAPRAGPPAAPATAWTIARSREQPPPATSPPVMPRLGPSDPTQVGPTPHRPAAPTLPSRPRPAVLPPVLPLEDEHEEFEDEPERAPAAPPRRRVPPPEPPDDGGGRRGALLIGGLFGGLLLVVLFVIISRSFSGGGPAVTPTRPPSATLNPTQVTKTPTPTPTATLAPAPTETPTAPSTAFTAVPEQPQPQPTEAPVVPPPA